MQEPDAHLKSIVCGFLLANGIPNREVPTADELRPDLLLSPETENETLMELKSKEDDPNWMQELNEDLESGRIVSRRQSTGKWNRIDGIIRHAVAQMDTIDPSQKLLRTVWFHCSGFNAALAEMRLKATIYGTHKLISTELPNVVTCHYFWNSCFFRYRHGLDGVVISRGDEAQLNLNDHSPRFERIVSSPIARAFGSAVYHPQQYLEDKGFMYNDSALPRDNAQTILDFLREKYSIDHLQEIHMDMHSAMMNRNAKEGNVPL
jgi:hypothetical protein